jgi:hypothetical protein
MSKLKNSKYKNTGILFELLVRQIASDILSNKEPHAATLVKKYFSNTEIAKEHKLYQTLINVQSLAESKADSLVETILKLSEKLNKTALRKEKYNLIKDIKENYNLEDFFKAKIQNYKINAAIFNLMEAHTSAEFTDPKIVIDNRVTLLEFLTNKSIDKAVVKDQVMEEYAKQDKSTRMMIYKMVVENFNSKYTDLLPEQKTLLSEFIKNISNTVSLKEYVNNQIQNVKLELEVLTSKITDKKIQIKLSEVNNILNMIPKSENISDDDVLNLMNYYELLHELRTA